MRQLLFFYEHFGKEVTVLFDPAEGSRSDDM
jgi:hypothetical protein